MCSRVKVEFHQSPSIASRFALHEMLIGSANKEGRMLDPGDLLAPAKDYDGSPVESHKICSTVETSRYDDGDL